jgi:hypothetical protein
MPSRSQRALLACCDRCSTKRDLRFLHGAILRYQHLLTAADAVAALAKLLRFVVISPTGDLRHATSRSSVPPPPTSPSSTTPLMRSLAASSSPGAAIELFTEMPRAGAAAPDAFTFTLVLKSCSRCLSPGRLPSDLHSQAIKHGCLGAHDPHARVDNVLLHGYASRAAVDDATRVRCSTECPSTTWSPSRGFSLCTSKANDLDSTREVFYQMPHRDIVSWTAMISAYAR